MIFKLTFYVMKNWLFFSTMSYFDVLSNIISITIIFQNASTLRWSEWKPHCCNILFNM